MPASTTQQQQLAEVLLAAGLLSPADLHRARAEQQRAGKSLGRVLIELGMCTEAGLVAALAQQLGLEFVDLTDRQVDTLAAASLPAQLCRRYGVLPIAYDPDGRLVVAMSDPSNVLALDDIRTSTDRDVHPVVATRTDIAAAIDRYARSGDSVLDVVDQLEGDESGDDLDALNEVVDDAPIVKFVNALIAQAVQDRASDIHIEPQDHDLRVRYRVDGVLHEVTTQSKKIHAGVVSRLKIMAELDIAERRIPQDGRISLKTGGKSIDLRVSTLPTVAGEKVVMRILDKSSVLLRLSDLGFHDDNYARYERSFTKPYGMILVTGPTGSGKSTTLYATLNIISRPEVNCVTVEDPVEYRLAGISQVQINPKGGLTFPSALRSILRQDPDVVLVGEMRDHETAQIGMEAALTGHLVLSTLHTNDAPSAVTRLTEMRIDPFLVASAVDCVLAQRLARRLCGKCKEPYQPTWDELRAAGLAVDDRELPLLYRSVGCASCSGTGYRGRLAVHEVMLVSEEIERLIVARASTEDVAKTARAQGMRSLREDGLMKVLLGLTTLEEIARVVV
ncbi:MAG TPA: ATPase, T2SS/T4P/T4SS family [Egibacteraceae bacterium]|jgi:type IV pilus assembly protein PilB|nr:ATPase, T2SS/T4P/T4SS family [Egibacteraceae bacterium]